MLENIISSASNESEIKVLKVASSLHICTGGWAKFSDAKLGTKESKDSTPKANDLGNLRSADLTLLVCPTNAGAIVHKREERIRQYLKHRRYVRAQVNQEPVSIAIDCQQSNVRVLNVVVIEGKQKDIKFAYDVANFMSGFFSELPNLFEKHANPIWCEPSRKSFRRRTIFRSAYAAYAEKGNEAYLPDIRREALDKSFELLLELPVSSSTLSKLIETTNDEIQKNFESKTPVKRVQSELENSPLIWKSENDFVRWYQSCVASAVFQHLPSISRKKKAKIWRDPLDILAVVHLGSTRSPENSVYYQSFHKTCRLLASTQRRSERHLRTIGLLMLGGIVACRDSVGWKFIEGARRKHAELQDSYGIKQLNQRFDGIGGWRELEKMGQVIRYESGADFFLGTINANTGEQIHEQQKLVDSLFYFADAFRSDQSLWNATAISSFAHWTAAVCGDSTERWQTWIGPSRRSNFSA